MVSDQDTPVLEQVITTNLWGGPGKLAVELNQNLLRFMHIFLYIHNGGIFDPEGRPLNINGFHSFFFWGVFRTNGTLWQGESLTFQKKIFKDHPNIHV